MILTELLAIPLNKNLYSLSYIFVTAGSAGILLSVSYIFIDVLKWYVTSLLILAETCDDTCQKIFNPIPSILTELAIILNLILCIIGELSSGLGSGKA